MKTHNLVSALSASLLLTGCGIGPDKTRDRQFFDRDHLSQMNAGVWVDPNGCDHWIIDDGVEGYLSSRTDKYGKPVCSGVASPNTAIGPFKRPIVIGDPL